jgi:hypothetical protein
MSKKNVHKLSSESDVSYSLLGISSHENDYRISWALNEHLGFHFSKVENHTFLHPKFGETLEFSQYMYTDEENSHVYRLTSNRCDNAFLLEEYKNIDFLLLFDKIEKSDLQQFLTRIKTISFVSAVFPIDFTQLKNKNRIL